MRRAFLPLAGVTSFVLSFALAAGVIAGNQLVARSDRFWAVGAVRAMSAEHYESLEDQARSADLVVVGKVQSIEAGREWVAVPELVDDPLYGEYAIARFATVKISIETIVGPVRSPLPDHSVVDLEVFLPTADSLATLRENFPEERALYFLRNKGPKDSVDFYRFTNDEQGLLREFDGRIRTAPAGETHFLTRLNGMRFDEVLASVVDARGS